jgi:hypothetical protein
VRFGITNSIVDPWIYILLRKENMMAIQKRFKRLCKQKKFATDSGGEKATPSSDSREKSFDITLSSANTLSSDNL